MDTSKLDLLNIIGRDTQLKKVAVTGGGEYHGPCPFCGGKDRFAIQLNRNGHGGRWACRACSPNWKDGIAYVMQRENCTFKEACEKLALSLDGNYRAPIRLGAQPARDKTRLAGTLKDDYASLTDPDWQKAAGRFIEQCIHNLYHTETGVTVWLDYLIEKRYLSAEVIQKQMIGFNAVDRNEVWGAVEVWLPRGVVIPWVDYRDEVIWKINIRRGKGAEPKYVQPKGGANGLYRTDPILPSSTVVMFEGEFDANALVSNIERKDVVAVATGSTEGSLLMQFVAEIAMADSVLLAQDADEGGDAAAAWWGKVLGSKARRLRPSGGKDVTDMIAAKIGLEKWMPRRVINGSEL